MPSQKTDKGEGKRTPEQSAGPSDAPEACDTPADASPSEQPTHNKLSTSKEIPPSQFYHSGRIEKSPEKPERARKRYIQRVGRIAPANEDIFGFDETSSSDSNITLESNPEVMDDGNDEEGGEAGEEGEGGEEENEEEDDDEEALSMDEDAFQEPSDPFEDDSDIYEDLNDRFEYTDGDTDDEEDDDSTAPFDLSMEFFSDVPDEDSSNEDGDLPEDGFERELLGSTMEPGRSLHMAVINGDSRSLVRWKAWGTGVWARKDIPDDPFQRELRGSMPEPRMSLHAAALRGNTKELRRWKNWGISLNGGKAQEDTPLHCAARAGDVGTVEELIEQGASISTTNMFHHSPLEIAARYGHTAVVKTLLEHGAGEDPDEIDRAYEATKSWAVFKTLTSHDDVFLEDVSPEQVHLDAPWVNQMLFRVIMQGRVNILRGLLNMGVNANCNGILFRWKPLQIAVRCCHIRCVSALLEGGADVNGRDDFMWTALHCAAQDGHHDIALLLLKAGADVLARCWQGRTPIAVSTDEATRHLLQNYNDS